jgi:peptidoglycan hydrolase-like protein with peptidoglycan-binding domain
MHDSRFGRAAADDNQIPPSGLLARPDRVALWAVVLAVVAMIAGAASAHASSSSGGVGSGSGGSGGAGAGTADDVTPGCPTKQFGRRTLEVGDCGDDVATLNWLLNSEDVAKAPLADQFETPTAKAVRAFQRTQSLDASGVVDSATSSELVSGMARQIATWYGPGFFGNKTACGKKLTRQTIGVAHRTLPCGSKVVLRYKGRYVRTTVIDRGPFANGAKWYLTQATAKRLHFKYTDDLRVAKLGR